MNQTIVEKISQRRRQILVHSCIYYILNENIIDDFKYDKWARELKALVKKYPTSAKQAVLVNEFEEWDKYDCLSGYNLPIQGQWVVNKAQQLLERKNNESKNL